MTAPDTMLRVISNDGRTRATVITTTALMNEIRRRHGMSMPVGVATGRVATAALLLSSTLKDDQVLTAEIHCNGPLGFVRATVDSHGGVRAYAAVSTVPDGLTAESAVGTAGHFKVVRDLGFGEPYSGIVPLVKGNIAADLAWYIYSSDQIKSAVGLDEIVEGRQITAAGAFLVQSMPPDSSDLQDELRELALSERMAERVEALPPLPELLRAPDFAAAVLGHLMPEGYKALETVEIAFRCACSRDRIEAGLRMVSSDELEEIIVETAGPLEVRCHFCGDLYTFTPEQIRAL